MVHDKLPDIYDKLAAAQIHFRAPDQATRVPEDNDLRNLGIDRDRIVCALLSKAANTSKAIVVLCDSDLADDAYALFRVLLENYVYLAWMLNKDWMIRVDTYWLFAAPVVTRWATVLQEHYPDQYRRLASTPHKLAAANAVSREVFDDKWIGWARFSGAKEPVHLRAMLDELYPDESKAETGNVLYARAYFESSLYVHSLPRSLQEMFAALQNDTCYGIAQSPSATKSATYVLRVSAMIMLATLSAVSAFIGADLESEITSLLDQLDSSSDGLEDDD